MKQELIDYLLDELDAPEREALEQRLRTDAALARQLSELSALFGLMRRGEEIEPDPAARARLVTEAERRLTPSLAQRLVRLPSLVHYRFQHSFGFRVAAVSLGVHLLAMVVLLFALGEKPSGRPGIETILQGQRPATELEAQRPAPGFVLRLVQRRLPHATRLRQFGVAGQERAIRSGLDALLRRQAADGSFGTPSETAYATLALLAEGDCSVQSTRGGRAIRAATRHLLQEVRRGRIDGAILAALVEDYSLSFDELREEERLDYDRAIRTLIRNVGGNEASQEGLALARMADFPLPAGRDLGIAAILPDGERAALLRRPPTRLSATIVLARGHLSLDRGRVRAWARPVFEQALAEVESGNVSAVVVLTLQAPYRL